MRLFEFERSKKEEMINRMIGLLANHAGRYGLEQLSDAPENELDELTDDELLTLIANRLIKSDEAHLKNQLDMMLKSPNTARDTH